MFVCVSCFGGGELQGHQQDSGTQPHFTIPVQCFADNLGLCGSVDEKNVTERAWLDG